MRKSINWDTRESSFDVEEFKLRKDDFFRAANKEKNPPEWL